MIPGLGWAGLGWAGLGWAGGRVLAADHLFVMTPASRRVPGPARTLQTHTRGGNEIWPKFSQYEDTMLNRTAL